MQAFHNDEKIKEKYLKRVLDHQKADEIIKGEYWLNGKGCAVGCTVHSSDHASYESELGIPEWMARLEDTLFEGMPVDEAKIWPYRFLDSISVGQDLDKVKAPFNIYILEKTKTYFNIEKFPEVKEAIDGVIDLWVKYPLGIDENNKKEWSAAESAARSAVWSTAESAARSAARSTAESTAESAASAASAAWSAANLDYSEKLLFLIKERND